MKKLSNIVSLLFFIKAGYTQVPSHAKLNIPDTLQEPPIEYPSFPGGEEKLVKYLRDSLRYPTGADKDGIQTRVIAEFLVNEDGSISEIKIMQSAGKLMDNEAIRIIKAMPKWKPGKRDGKPFPVWMDLPIQIDIKE